MDISQAWHLKTVHPKILVFGYSQNRLTRGIRSWNMRWNMCNSAKVLQIQQWPTAGIPHTFQSHNARKGHQMHNHTPAHSCRRARSPSEDCGRSSSELSNGSRIASPPRVVTSQCWEIASTVHYRRLQCGGHGVRPGQTST